MKMYSTAHPEWLMIETRSLLRREGYEPRELPESMLSEHKYRTRTIAMSTTAPVVSPYWMADFTIYVDDPHSIHSLYNPAHKATRSMPGVWSATFNQWGLWLGALFDVADGITGEDPSMVRVAECEYDSLSSRALRRDDGEPFNNSADLFHHLTCGQFSTEMRERQTVNLSCRVHRWASGDNGLSRCRNCGHLHRFGGRWQEQVHD